MLVNLEEFKTEHHELKDLRIEKNKETKIFNKLIKSEIIDMADRMEELEKMLLQ